MGKYFIKIHEGEKDYPLTIKIIVLNSIANELAEANRLKRIELGHIIAGMSDSVNLPDEEKKELEDQA